MAYTFVQAARHGGTQGSVNRVVIHCTVSPTRDYADNIANYFRTTDRPASAHYVVDQARIVQCLRETTIGYHAPPNTGSVGIELCDPQKGSTARWQDVDHQAMLRLAAGLTREIAARWGVPLRKLSASDLRAGKRGICGHVDVSDAWHLTDHGDPGAGFPWGQFMDLVTGQEDDVSAEDVWTKDGIIPSPPWIAEGGNKYWSASSYLQWLYRNQAKQTERIAGLEAQLAEIKALLTPPQT